MGKLKKESESLLYPFIFVGILWLIHLLGAYFALNIGKFGILPRTAEGLIGIFTGPLIHESRAHLVSNALPLLILGILVFNFYRPIAFEVLTWVYLISGLCVWIIGRDAYHIGASGLVYGFASFIFLSGLFRGELKAILLALLVAVVYGGIIWGILPGKPGISWQAHLYGALTGGMCAFFYRKVR